MKKIKLIALAILACLVVTGCSCERQATTYTVTFDSNGGSAVASQTIKEGNKVVAPTNPTRDGYTFDGWYIDNVKYDFTRAVNSNFTLTANWTSNGSTDTPSCTKTCSTGYTLDSAKCECVKNSSSDNTKPVSGNKTKPNTGTKTETKTETNTKPATPTTVKVTKVELTANKTSLTVGDTATLTATVTPSNATNKTITWKSSNDAVATVVDGKVTAVSAGTVTITATADGQSATVKITVNAAPVANYTVKFDSAGGSDVASQTVKAGSKVSAPTNPTKEGYTFLGWYNGSTKVTFPVTVNSNLTLTAKWQKDTYTYKVATESEISSLGLMPGQSGVTIWFKGSNVTSSVKYVTSGTEVLGAKKSGYLIVRTDRLNDINKIVFTDNTTADVSK